MLPLGRRIFFTILLVLQATHFKLLSSSILTLSPCACKYNGHIYNLSSLAKKDGARFIKQSRNYYYGYNPCIPFTQGDSQECRNVAICYWSGTQMHDGIGYQDDVYCQVEKGILALIFKQRGTRLGMKSTVQFKCNLSKILVSDAEMNIVKDEAEPILEVEHKCCCPDGCPGNIPPTVSPSTPSTPPAPTVFPYTYTLSPPIEVSSETSIDFNVVWIAVAAAIVFIAVFSISIGFCLLRKRPPAPLLITPPPPPYDEVCDYHANDDERRREGEEHEEPSDIRDNLPHFGVPEYGFTSPVQVSERKPLFSQKSK